MPDRHPLREATREQMVEWAEMWEREAASCLALMRERSDDPWYSDTEKFYRRNVATAAVFRGLVAQYDQRPGRPYTVITGEGKDEVWHQTQTPWAVVAILALSRGDDAHG